MTDSKGHLLFINRVFPPDSGASGLRLLELCQGMAEKGWKVSVLTNRGRNTAPEGLHPNINLIRLSFGSVEGKPKPANIDGFTPEQRFFLGWAQVWAGKYTPEAERLQVKTNTHSLPRWRVNGPLSNMPQFKEAFGCKPGQAMVRSDSCLIW